MKSYEWYQQLIKPSWSPPSWLFGPVWTILYIIIFLTFGFVLYKFTKKDLSLVVVLPFILNLIFNVAFTPIQFGLQSNILAAVDIFLVLATLVWAIISIWPYYQTVSLANIPYLLWVLFATVLQFTITYLNFNKI